MISKIKQGTKKGLQRLGARLLGPEVLAEVDRASSTTKAMQILLSLRYQEMVRRRDPLPSLRDVEFRTFSQNGEDGILLFLFSVAGTTNRKLLDLGCGSGLVANTTNLLVHHGWTGVLLDGDENNVALGREFFARSKDTAGWPPTVAQAWLDAEGINELVREHGLQGEIDLLSIDLDGNDYWIWQALEQVQPRVVVLEYLDLLGSERALTVPYRRDFVGEHDAGGLRYGGASLPAFAKLGRRKGYRLVGCQQYGYNAFFVRNDVAPDLLPEVPVASCFTHPKVTEGIKTRVGDLLGRPWVEV